MIGFVQHEAHRRAIEVHLRRALADPDCAALAVCGSTARGDARALSDVDLMLLLREGTPDRPFASEETAGVYVEVKATRPSTARQRMDRNPMEIYSFLDGRAIHDPHGTFADLQVEARQRFDRFVRSDQRAVKYWLAASQRKLVAAEAAGDVFLAACVAEMWPILDGIWAVNNKPTPPQGAVWAHLADLGVTPPRAWLDDLVLGDARVRIAAAGRLLQWTLQRL